MYYIGDKAQIVIEGFAMPFGGKLDAQNRWMKLAGIIPWNRIKEIYLRTVSTETNRRALSSRIAFGAIFIKEYKNFTDGECVAEIQENPYIQYVLCLHEFRQAPLFDPSMKPADGKPAKGKKNPNTSKKRGRKDKKNRGKLIMDATVAPSDVKYPTDIYLLNQCREHYETAINILWKELPHTGRKLPYSAQNARKSYLNIAKSKR